MVDDFGLPQCLFLDHGTRSRHRGPDSDRIEGRVGPFGTKMGLFFFSHLLEKDRQQVAEDGL
jgi:hypothetical protein